jgi:hypothetical protein
MATQATPATIDELRAVGVDRMVVTCAEADLEAAKDDMWAVADRLEMRPVS